MTKRVSQAEWAQRWFEAFSALDQHAAVRAELAHEQVPQHTIAALYGSVSDGVLATLAQRYAAVKCKPEAQFADWAELLFELDQISKRLAAPERAALQRELEAEPTRRDFVALTDALTPLVHQRFGWTHRRPRKDAGADAARVIWFALWAMTQRTTLTRRNQNRADKLIVWVGKNLAPRDFELSCDDENR